MEEFKKSFLRMLGSMMAMTEKEICLRVDNVTFRMKEDGSCVVYSHFFGKERIVGTYADEQFELALQDFFMRLEANFKIDAIGLEKF